MRYKSVLHNYAESNGLLTAFFVAVYEIRA